MKKRQSLLSLSLLLILTTALAPSAFAEKICKTTDPTGTPLNVRDRPNGKIINTLTNGTEVHINEITSDEQGRPWTKISIYSQGRYRVLGWVIREFISCYNE